MRADRLLATLLLLQARGSVTAREVADELEVSERTARRDLDALAVAGIPVYSKQGRGGGWQLVGGATTDLTGLHSAEARALLTMAAVSGRATPDFVSAMRKLVQALPAPMRDETQRVMASVISDDTSWRNRRDSEPSPPRHDEWLEPLQRAVLDHRRLHLAYAAPRKGRTDREIDPLGLIVKQGRWYVLASTAAGRRSFRVDRIIGVGETGERFEPPESFDLDAEWAAITANYLDGATDVRVEAIVVDSVLAPLRAMGVDTVVGTRREDDRVAVELGAPSARILAAQLAGLMSRIELVEPPAELVERLAEIGTELTRRFASTAPDRHGPPAQR